MDLTGDIAEQFLELSGDLCLVVSPSGSIVRAISAWKEPIGWTARQLTGRSLRDLFAAENSASITRMLAKAADGREAAVVQARARSTSVSGQSVWISMTGRVAADGRHVLVVGRIIHEKAEAEVFSTLFFESASVGLNLCKMDGTWVRSNPAFLRMIGYSREEADNGLTYWQLTPGKYGEQEKLQLKRLSEEGKYGPYEKEFIRKDGSLIPVRLNGFIVIKDGSPFIWSIIEDISTEKRLQREIERKTELFEAIFDNVPSAVFLKDAKQDFKVTHWNKAAEQMFQMSRADVIGKRAHDLWPKEHADQYLADDLKVLREGHLVDIPEEPVLTRDRGTIFAHTKKVPLKLSSERDPSLLIGISEDISARKKLEADLRAAIEVRDEFLSIASHELKTPFTALYMQLQLICRLAPDECGHEGGRVAPLAKGALAAARQMSSLLDELLDITRIRAGKLRLNKERVDLKESVERAVAQMSEEIHASGSRLAVHAEAPVRGWWDVNRINQIVVNLLSNALKYGQGTDIDVTVDTGPDGRSARLSVRDRGMGIPKEMHEVIFRRYERMVSSEKISGLGLGLYIVRMVVEAHGGDIRVESAPGQGALFEVSLPMAGDEGARKGDQAS